MLPLASRFIPACLIAVSAFASPCGNKIGDLLCQQMTNLTDTSKVMIQIILPQPPFSYPNKMEVSLDSARNYSLMMLDSLARNLTAIKPRIDTLFSKYDLRSVSNPNQRMLSPNIPYDYVINAIATVGTINQMTSESLVAYLGLIVPGTPVTTTTEPVFHILATQFPFDTVFSGLGNPLITFWFDTITVARYGLTFYFGRLGGPVGIFGYTPIQVDFCLSSSDYYSDIRFPQDTTFLLTGKHYDGQCNPPCTSYVNIDSSYKTHEYRFQLASAILYMKVTDVYSTDSLKVRFDTLSFLSTSNIRIAPEKTNFSLRIGLTWENGFVNIRGIQPNKDCKIAIYDVAGKILFRSVSNGRNNGFPAPISPANGIFLIKISTEQGDFLFRKNLMK